MLSISKQLFRRVMKEMYLLGLNDGYEINADELTERYIRQLEGKK